MSSPEDTSPPSNTALTSPTSAAPAHSSTAVVEVPHEDDFCERRRQQNREAQRRFRNKKNKEREAAAATASPAATTPTAIHTAATLDPVVPPHILSQDSLSIPTDPIPTASEIDLFPVLACPSATSNHDTHDYFGHGSFPEINALLAPYRSATGEDSTLFGAASSIASPSASYSPFDILQNPPYSFTGLHSNSTADGNSDFDALFGKHYHGQSMGYDNFGKNLRSSLTTPRRAPKDPLPTSRSTSSSVESHPTPSTILPALRSQPDDQRLETSSQSSSNAPATTTPPTPASSCKHTPLPKRVLSPSESDDDKPLLHISVDSGHQGIVRILLDSGVDINERDRDGSTALHLAVKMRQDAIIRLLLERGALATVKDSEGKTPTHLAIYSNFETGLKILLNHDANMKKRNRML